jgi:hypothetical protein
MSDIKNPQTVKRQLDEADNMIQILQNVIRRGLKIEPQDALDRFERIRAKLKFAMDNISG